MRRRVAAGPLFAYICIVLVSLYSSSLAKTTGNWCTTRSVGMRLRDDRGESIDTTWDILWSALCGSWVMFDSGWRLHGKGSNDDLLPKDVLSSEFWDVELGFLFRLVFGE